MLDKWYTCGNIKNKFKAIAKWFYRSNRDVFLRKFTEQSLGYVMSHLNLLMIVSHKDNLRQTSQRDIASFMVTFWEENKQTTWEICGNRDTRKTTRDDLWKSFILAWKSVSIEIDTYCCRSQDTEMRGNSRQSVKHLVIIMEFVHRAEITLAWSIGKSWNALGYKLK